MPSNAYKPLHDKIKSNKAVELYSSGLSIRETAKRLNVSKDKVYRWIKEAGIMTRSKARPSVLSDHPIEDLWLMVENLGLRKASESLGVSHVSLWEYLKRRE